MAKLIGEHTMTVDGLEVRVLVKRVKNTSLRVRSGGVVEVTVPPWESDRYVERLVRERRSWIDRAANKIDCSPMAQAEGATPEQIAEWRAVVEACVPLLVAEWEPIIGVKAGKLAYRNMKSRWGSCQPSTGRICINIRLALYPPECLEYVVVHELCHLLVAGHGPKFHALMDGLMPDWKQRRAKLR